MVVEDKSRGLGKIGVMCGYVNPHNKWHKLDRMFEYVVGDLDLLESAGIEKFLFMGDLNIDC